MSTQASAGRIEISDIDRYQQVTPPWQVVLRQMSPGRFRATTEYLQVNGILVYREHWSHRVVATGTTPAGYFVVGGPASPRSRIGWCGTELDARCLAFGRSSSEVDFVIPDGCRHLVLLVPNRLLVTYLGEELAATVLRDSRFLGCPPGCGDQLLDMLDRLIDKYLVHSKLLTNQHVCRAIEWQLLGSLTELLLTGNPAAGCQPLRERHSAVRRAITYSKGLRRPIAVPDLAAAAGVSQRLLELGFQEVIGTTPRGFLQLNRLNRVRMELAAANQGSSSVTEILAHWGFSELGRSAVEYKRLFGESPSATLARETRRPPKRLAGAVLERSSR